MQSDRETRRPVGRSGTRQPHRAFKGTRPGSGRAPAVIRGVSLRYAVLLNRESGALLGDGGALVDVVRAGLAAAGEAGMEAVPGDRLAGRVKALVAADAPERPDAVIIGGGDGSVSAAARALIGTDIALGVLPLGTFNLFARALGMPLEPEAAIAALTNGRPRRVDTMEINGRTVLQHLSIGLQPRVILLRQEMPHATRLGKLARGLAAWLRVVRRPPRFEIAVRVDGETLRRRTSGLVVSNDPMRAGLGAAPVSADLEEGRVAVYVSAAASRAQLVRLSVAASLGLWQETGLVEELVATEIEIGADKPQLLVSVDGELERFETPLRCRSWPGSLAVLLPP